MATDFNAALEKARAIAAKLSSLGGASRSGNSAPSSSAPPSGPRPYPTGSNSTPVGGGGGGNSYSSNKRSRDDSEDSRGGGRYGDLYDSNKRTHLSSSSSSYSSLYSSSSSSRDQYGSYADTGRTRHGLGSEGAPSSGAYGPSSSSAAAADSRIKVTQEMSVPQSMVGLVIGRSGETLKRIEKDTGCRIQIDSSQAAEETSHRGPYATITGSEAEVREAKRQIQEILDGRNNESRPGSSGAVTARPVPPGQSTFPMEVPANKVGLVIGKGGETIKMLQEQSGARIAVVPDNQSDMSVNTRTVNITGTQNSIDVAKTLIGDLVFKGPSYGGQQGYSGGGGGGYGPSQHQYSGMNSEIKVPNDKVGLIIGRGGDQIKFIQNSFNVRVQVEPTPDANGERVVRVYGQNRDNIDSAVAMIYDKTGGNGRRDGGGAQASAANPYAAYGYPSDPYGQAQGYDYSAYWDPSQGYYDASAYYAAAAAASAGQQQAQGGDAAASAAGGEQGQQGQQGAAAGSDQTGQAAAGQGASSDPAANAAAWEAYYQYYAQYAAAAAANQEGAPGASGAATGGEEGVPPAQPN
ncbi:hypothetical protein DFJ73DRAFT_823790 [Zopfochytrium polystomum]|nr:hypothetical protein DFJ73DRAFT_823790 [Zopfochytrium polystomum]